MKKTFLILSCLYVASCERQPKPHHITERPYRVFGKKYRPQTTYNYREVGYASWYGQNDHGKPTSTGVTFNKYAMTAAHRTLPLPSVVKVTNLENGRSVVLLVNDHGPFAKTNSRIIDVSEAAAKKLGFHHKGSAKVRVECLKNESIAASLSYKKKPYAKHSNKHYAMINKLPSTSMNIKGYDTNARPRMVAANKTTNDFISFNNISARIRAIFGSKKSHSNKKSSLANRAI